ncbi:MAG: peptide ABC transporter substrate-binding protein [Synergistaceae bacterium]|nr:peptide ABC transporter substrate-binding protein [Synergistaceae bacterium]
MMRRIFAAIVITLMAVSCSYAGEKEITYNLGIDPQTIDPTLNYALDGAIVDANIFEGLLRTDFNNNPEPGCAESWDVSADGLKWTFHLRDNLKWSDGVPLTASHFRDGILRLIDPHTGSAYATFGFFIKNAESFYNGKVSSSDVGISAPDDRTLIITLEHVNPLMLYHMAFPSFFPARMDIVRENPRGWAAHIETLTSNGPFKVESWRHGPGGEIVIARNPRYWDADNVKIDRVRLVLIGDGNTALAAFRAGRVDYMTTVPSLMAPILIKRGEAVSEPSHTIYFYAFNVTRKPFDDVRVRRAFMLAIDRKIITDKIALGGNIPASGMICTNIPGANPSEDFRTEGGELIPVRANVDEARRLLAEAGYPNGEGFPEVTYKYSSSSGRKVLPEVLQGMWKTALGVKVNLVNEEWKVFLTTKRNGDFDIAESGWAMDFPDASNLLDTMASDSQNNDSRYDNPEYDALIKKAQVEPDRLKRMNYLHEAERILVDDMPLAPLYFYSAAVMKSPRVKGIYHSPSGIIYFRGTEVD